MTYRPYPSPDRARHQLARHAHYEDVPVVTVSPETARLMKDLVESLQPTTARAMANAAASFRLMPSSHDLFPAPGPSDPGSSR